MGQYFFALIFHDILLRFNVHSINRPPGNQKPLSGQIIYFFQSSLFTRLRSHNIAFLLTKGHNIYATCNILQKKHKTSYLLSNTFVQKISQ